MTELNLPKIIYRDMCVCVCGRGGGGVGLLV